jgi:hypothetical protein
MPLEMSSSGSLALRRGASCRLKRVFWLTRSGCLGSVRARPFLDRTSSIRRSPRDGVMGRDTRHLRPSPETEAMISAARRSTRALGADHAGGPVGGARADRKALGGSYCSRPRAAAWSTRDRAENMQRDGKGRVLVQSPPRTTRASSRWPDAGARRPAERPGADVRREGTEIALAEDHVAAPLVFCGADSLDATRRVFPIASLSVG